MSKFTVLAFCLITQSALAQSRFTADSYLAEPEKNLGKTVTLCVDSVTVPAVNAVTKDPFRVFRVNTRGQNQKFYESGGMIYVKVPREDSDAFARRHNSPGKQGPKLITGKFAQWRTEYDRSLGSDPTEEKLWRAWWTTCYGYSHFYLDMTK